MGMAPIMAALNIATLGATEEATKAVQIAQEIKEVAEVIHKSYIKIKGIIDAAQGGDITAIFGGQKQVAIFQNVKKLATKYVIPATVLTINADQYSRNFAKLFDETSPTIAAEINKRFGKDGAFQIKRKYGLHHLTMKLKADGVEIASDVIGMIALADPTGIGFVVTAFLHPRCKFDQPFPPVKPLYSD